MGASLVTSATFAFADGNAGHSCDLGSAPSVGHLDVLCVNSNTVVTTPSGFTAAVSAVTNQGAYIFYRKAVGGEGQTVTVQTTGDHNTVVAHSRWSNVDAFEVGGATQVNGSSGNTTPAHSTGVLAETQELVVALGAMHSIGTANQNTPVWSSGYTALTSAVQGSGATGVYNLVGYRTNAGTAAESPNVSWSGDGAQNRYMLAAAFTSGGAIQAISPANETDSAQALGRTKARALGVATEADQALALAGASDQGGSSIMAGTTTSGLRSTTGSYVAPAVTTTGLAARTTTPRG